MPHLPVHGPPRRLSPFDVSELTETGLLGSLDAPGAPSAVSVGVFVLWAASGVAAVIVLCRREGGVLPYAMLGAIFGPLLIPVLRERRQLMELRAGPARLSAGRPGPGPVDVLIGVRHDEAPTLVADALRVLGDRLGQVTVARVVDAADLAEGGWSPRADEAAARLEMDAALTPDCEPTTMLVPGDPAQTLPDLAASEGCQLMIVAPSLARALGPAGSSVMVVTPMAPEADGRDRGEPSC